MFYVAFFFTLGAMLLASFMAPMTYLVGDYKAMAGFICLPLCGVAVMWYISRSLDNKRRKFLR